jgi:hypothetical protein|tara:strand:- start:1310 stop:1903 length:594 start_codon:yes stop_codon:yes gene_type:complete
MKTIDIHGKPYVEVNERIKYFREAYDHWSLITEFVELTENRCVMKATILDDVGRVIATGTAEELKGSTFINKTSYIENCETSAWGRALGNLGIGIDTSIASADEVNLAIAQHKQKPKTKPKLDDKKYEAMIEAIGEGKFDVVKERMNNYKLTKKQQTELDKHIEEQKEEMNIAIKQEKELDKKVEELAIHKAFKEFI